MRCIYLSLCRSIYIFCRFFFCVLKIRWSLLAAVCFYLIGRKVCLMLTICLCNAIEIGIAPSSLLFSSASFNSLTVCRHHIYPSILVIDATRSQQEKWTNATAATTQHDGHSNREATATTAKWVIHLVNWICLPYLSWQR